MTARWMGPDYRNLVVFVLFLIVLRRDRPACSDQRRRGSYDRWNLDEPRRHQLLTLLPIIVIGVAAVLPSLGLDPYWTRQIILISILSLIVSGLNLSFGYAREFALVQPAFYAAGAYLAGYLAKNVMTTTSCCWSSSAASAALAVGLVTGERRSPPRWVDARDQLLLHGVD